MAFLSKKAFGDRAGVSRQRISVMCRDGHLTMRPDGKLDTEDPTNENYLKKKDRPDGLKYTDIKKAKPKQSPTPSKKKKIPPEQNNDEIATVEDEVVLDGIPDDLKLMRKHDLDRMKSAVSIMKEKTKHEIDRGNYIDRSTVKKTFHTLYRIDTEEFLQLSSTLSARICQDIFDTNDPEIMTKVSELLDTDFYKTQNHIRVALNRELSDMGIEAVG